VPSHSRIKFSSKVIQKMACERLTTFFHNCGHTKTTLIHGVSCRSRFERNDTRFRDNDCSLRWRTYDYRHSLCERCLEYKAHIQTMNSYQIDGMGVQYFYMLGGCEAPLSEERIEARRLEYSQRANDQAHQRERVEIERRGLDNNTEGNDHAVIERRRLWEEEQEMTRRTQEADGVNLQDQSLAFDPDSNSSHLLEPVQPSGDVCPICLCDMIQGEEIRRLPCSHQYHDYCIKRHFQLESFCPICRHQFNLVRVPDIILDSPSQEVGAGGNPTREGGEPLGTRVVWRLQLYPRIGFFRQ
jgi:hypothetical protein